jgi:hypothetical protein
MHMAPRAAAWVAWVVWTCNTGRKLVTVKRERTYRPLFFLAYCGAVADSIVFSDSNSDWSGPDTPFDQ